VNFTMKNDDHAFFRLSEATTAKARFRYLYEYALAGPLSVHGCTTGMQRARYRSAPDGIRTYEPGWWDAGPM
jgi:hypothetical protein